MLAPGDVRLQLARAWCDHTAHLSQTEPERIRALNHLVLVLRLSGQHNLLVEAATIGAKNLEFLACNESRDIGITAA